MPTLFTDQVKVVMNKTYHVQCQRVHATLFELAINPVMLNMDTTLTLDAGIARYSLANVASVGYK